MPKEPRTSTSRKSRRSPVSDRNSGRKTPRPRPQATTSGSKPEQQQKQHEPPAREKDLGASQWPLEYFPPPPDDGHWVPKTGGKPVNKIPAKPTGVPPPPSPTLQPPVMQLTYPPPPPFTADDPKWLPEMVGDVQRQRNHLQSQLALAHAEASSALVEATLVQGELQCEIGLMQTFLNHVAYIAGNGFVRRLLSDVDGVIAHRLHPDGEEASDVSQDEAIEEEEEVEAAVTEDGGSEVEDDAPHIDKGKGKSREVDIPEEQEEKSSEDEEQAEDMKDLNAEQLAWKAMLSSDTPIPILGSPPPGVETNPLAVGRRRGRPLRRDPYRIREDHRGEPVLYEVVS
ncbi:hypothetical protein PISMIDRAFT_683116 [Pisolithus microcarpus 441]|uniref:Uncharacterized protein n=1 Tax=Pisolithus microcarpus 441 TaxID=765257 RepID=A0A0C9YZS4_9AGAM|nr:hypothetical protein PISMIDRAFT_683116 [Pisolithus microcarpus 441]